VAIKMQYDGVADSIDSDLDNLKRVADLFSVFPRGLYIDEVIRVTRKELHWECDYNREAAYQRRYSSAISVSPDKYYAPAVIDHLSNRSILCAEFVDGVEIDTLVNAPQELRNRIGTLMLELTLRELFEFKVMQTDPNPANYLYNKEHDRLNLLDFGASREFGSFFLDNYAEIIHGASLDDKEKIMKHSHDLKFLTGEENRHMLTAHH